MRKASYLLKMSVDKRLFILFLLYLSTIFLLFYFLQKYQYLSSLFDTYVVFGSTLFGVYTAFHINNKSQNNNNKRRTLKLLHALLLEVGNNQAKSKTIKDETGINSISLQRLFSHAPQGVIDYEFSYVLLSEDFFYNLYLYVNQMKVINKKLDFMYDQFIKLDGQNKEVNINMLNKDVTTFLKLSYLLQSHIQLFMNMYNIASGPNFKDRPFFSMLKEVSTREINEYEKLLDDVCKMNESEIHHMKTSFEKHLDQ